jgi:hypothetical protein
MAAVLSLMAGRATSPRFPSAQEKADSAKCFSPCLSSVVETGEDGRIQHAKYGLAHPAYLLKSLRHESVVVAIRKWGADILNGKSNLLSQPARVLLVEMSLAGSR